MMPTGVAETFPKNETAKSVDALAKLYSDAYETTLDAVSAPVKVWDHADFLGGIKEPGMQTSAFEKIESMLGDVLPESGSMISAKRAHQIESNLKAKAYNWKGSTDAFQREQGNALNEAAQEFGESWRHQVAQTAPLVAKQVSELDHNFRNFVPLRRAASKSPDLVDPNNYTPRVLLNAIRMGDKSLDKGRWLEGNLPQQKFAQAAEEVLGSRALGEGSPKLAVPGTLAAGAFVPVSALAIVSGSMLYAHPTIQRVLTGQNITQKAFTKWYDALPDAEKQAFVRSAQQFLAQGGREVGMQGGE